MKNALFLIVWCLSSSLVLATLNTNFSFSIDTFTSTNPVNPFFVMSITETETQWHTGEEAMHKLLRVPQHDNPTSPYLTPHAANILIRSPLIAIGALDEEGRPWTTIWGGEPGLSRPIAQSVIGIKTTAERLYDPVLNRLFGDKADGELVQQNGTARMVSGLAIDLESRRRVKLYGKMIAGAITATEEGIGEVQMAIKIEQSLGNCPKYLNKKHIIPHIPQPKLVSDTLPLPQAAIKLIEKADLFFISSSNHEVDMDTNHRGGPRGFVRILSNDDGGLTIVYPEYSGNRLYQTLGNLNTTPKAGLVFPDFTTGDVLYITGRTEILTGKSASNLISHTNLAVKITVDAAKLVADGLAFRGQEGEYSPYNPPIRYLSTEKQHALPSSNSQILAKLVNKTILTPTIARFRFQLPSQAKGNKWKPGQWVALSFADELDIGYSHMRDDDPKSLNDDFLRTFTVSSRADQDSNEFEITIRKVGVITDFMFKTNIRSGLEIAVQGFGGDFFIDQDGGERIAFVAGGVGITPLLAQAKDIDLEKLELFWTVRGEDLGLVTDTFEGIPELEKSTRVFVTGKVDEESEGWKKLIGSRAKIEKKRMAREDLQSEEVKIWYLCTGTNFRSSLLEWLAGKKVLFEDFNY